MFNGLQSPLLSMLFSGYLDASEPMHHSNTTQRLKILDVGPACPATVRFFSQIRSRLYFADLFAEQMQTSGSAGQDDSIELSFPTLENYPDGEQFDLCFLWDFLNYLDTPALQAFNLALQPFIHSGTRAYAFTTQSSRQPMPELLYGIEDQEHLCENLRSQLDLKLHTHSLSDLKDYFPCLNITRSRLLTDGRIEIFMSAHGN